MSNDNNVNMNVLFAGFVLSYLSVLCLCDTSTLSQISDASSYFEYNSYQMSCVNCEQPFVSCCLGKRRKEKVYERCTCYCDFNIKREKEIAVKKGPMDSTIYECGWLNVYVRECVRDTRVYAYDLWIYIARMTGYFDTELIINIHII